MTLLGAARPGRRRRAASGRRPTRARRRCARSASTSGSTSTVPLDLALPRRGRARRSRSASYFGGKPVILVARVLRVPDALHAGAERPRRARCARCRSTSARSSTSSPSASTRARRPSSRRRRRRPTSREYGRAGAAAAGTSSPATRRRSSASPQRSASATATTPTRSSTRTPPAIMVLTPRRHASRATSTASSTRRATCGSALVEAADEPDRLAGRSAAALLLPLRSRAPAATARSRSTLVRAGGVVTVLGARRASSSSMLPARAPRRAAAARDARCMLERLAPLPRAGVDRRRAQVDALYFFLIGVTLFFALLIAGAARRLRDPLPPPLGATTLPRADPRLARARARLVDHPVRASRWSSSSGARASSSTLARPPDDALEVYVVGKQWMWKLQHLEGRREINELHVPVGRPVKLTMTSEDVIHSFYVPAFRMKQDVVPGPLHDDLVRGHEDRQLPPLLRRVLRHRALAHDRPRRRDGAGRLPGAGSPAHDRATAARRRGAPVSPAAAGEALFAQLGCATCHAAPAGALGPSLAGLFGKTVRLEDGQQRHRRRGLPARVDPRPAGEGRRRLPAGHADLPGAGERGAAAAADRVHQVARAPAARSATASDARRHDARRRPTT